MIPTLMLLPGMDGTGELFAPLIKELNPAIPVIVVRYPDEPLGYLEHENLVDVVLPKDSPYVVLGESFSGPIAISIAARSPPGLVGCILCASFITSPRPVLKLLRPLLGILPAQEVPETVASYFLMGRFATAELRRMRIEALQHVSSKTLVSRLEAIAQIDVSDAARAVRVPTLYIRATEDRLVPPAAAATYARLVRNARTVDIEGPHWLLQANPTGAVQVIEEFLRQAVAADTGV